MGEDLRKSKEGFYPSSKAVITPTEHKNIKTTFSNDKKVALVSNKLASKVGKDINKEIVLVEHLKESDFRPTKMVSKTSKEIHREETNTLTSVILTTENLTTKESIKEQPLPTKESVKSAKEKRPLYSNKK